MKRVALAFLVGLFFGIAGLSSAQSDMPSIIARAFHQRESADHSLDTYRQEWGAWFEGERTKNYIKNDKRTFRTPIGAMVSIKAERTTDGGGTVTLRDVDGHAYILWSSGNTDESGFEKLTDVEDADWRGER